MTVAYFNHQFVDLDSATVLIVQKGSCLGDGVFTTLKLLNGKLCFFYHHLKRLKAQAHYLNFSFPEISEEIFYKLVKYNKAYKGCWRVKIILSSAELFQKNGKQKKSNFIIFLQKEEISKEEKHVCIYPYPVVSPLARIKSLSYMDRLFLKNYAEKKGYNDCFSVNEKNDLLEGCFSNFFFIKDQTLFFPSPILPYFRGITLKAAILSGRKMGLKIKSGKFKRSDLMDASVFLCNSMMDIVPVESIEGKKMKKNSLIENTLLQTYKDLTEQYWLTVVPLK